MEDTKQIRAETFKIVDEMFTSGTYAQLDSIWETRVLKKSGKKWNREEWDVLDQTFQEMAFILDQHNFY